MCVRECMDACVCACVCACVYACVFCMLCIYFFTQAHVHLHPWEGQKRTSGILIYCFQHPCMKVSHWTWNLSFWLGWLASKLLGSSGLCLPESWGSKQHVQPWIVMRVLRDSSPYHYHTCSVKTFSHWIISPVRGCLNSFVSLSLSSKY